MVIKQCESGRWLGWPKNRQDIMASGETKEEVIENLKEMFIAVTKYEAVNSTAVS